MELGTLAALFAVALVAGVLDAIAGGGGLITLPALLFAGVPPVHALATNKIQALAGVASSAVGFTRAGQVNPLSIKLKIATALVGGAIGALSLRWARPDLLRQFTPFILIAVASFFLFSKQLRRSASRPLVGEHWMPWLAVLPVSLYDGFFGPGTGAIYVALFVLLSGRTLSHATAEAKVLNASGSVAAAVIFLPGSVIVWPAAVAMAAGGAIGGQIGAAFAIKWGAPFIRVAVVVVSLALTMHLVAQQLGWQIGR